MARYEDARDPLQLCDGKDMAAGHKLDTRCSDSASAKHLCQGDAAQCSGLDRPAHMYQA